MINRIAKKIERFIILSLMVMMAGVLIVATFELGYYVFISIVSSGLNLEAFDNLLNLFGMFLLVLIGIELLETIKIYLRETIVHVEVVVLVAIIAIARKVVVMKVEDFSGMMLLGIGGLVLSLSISYYLIKRAGILKCDLRTKGDDKPSCQDQSSE